jgi:uncharacterized delta-60 repeat protein
MIPRSVPRIALAAGVLALTLGVSGAESGAGALDPSFGKSGMTVVTHFGSRKAVSGVGAAAVQPDGKIVVAGPRRSYDGPGTWDFETARYTASGTLDSGFGTNGEVETQLGDPTTTNSSPGAVVIQPNGDIAVAGTVSLRNRDGYALARYTPNGTLDPGFGTDGKVTTAFVNDLLYGTPHPPVAAAAIQRDGKIVVTGLADRLARYLSH